MTIPFGRRLLIVSLVSAPVRSRIDLPMAVEAADAELARLNGLQAATDDRRRWEADAILYGPVRPR